MFPGPDNEVNLRVIYEFVGIGLISGYVFDEDKVADGVG